EGQLVGTNYLKRPKWQLPERNETGAEFRIALGRVANHRESALDLMPNDILADGVGVHSGDADADLSDRRLDHQGVECDARHAARSKIDVHRIAALLEVGGVLDGSAAREAE